jgi:hypothetical protein
MAAPRVGGGEESIFNGYISPRNIFEYIRRLLIFLYFSVLRSIIIYIHRCYVPQLFRWLTKKFNIYFLIIQLNSSILTDEYFMISCSGFKTVSSDFYLIMA